MSSNLKSDGTPLQFVHHNQKGRRELISYSALHRSFVTVYISPEKYPFYFHKGRLCQHSSYFEKAFHGSFKEATTGSMYLEEDGVDEFKLFEEWLYLGKFSYPEDSDDPSLLLVKVFCFAEKVGISNLQNVTLDAIRDRAVEQHVSQKTPNTTYHTYVKPQTPFGSQRPIFDLLQNEATTTSPAYEEPVTRHLLPATASAITYAYQNTPERSPLRELLADIFAYNIKPEALCEDILSFPIEFMRDVLFITMKRLPFRLKAEEAKFDKNAKKYHAHVSTSSRNDRTQRSSEDRKTSNGSVAEAATVNEDDTWGFGGLAKSLSGQEKKCRHIK